MSSISRRTWLRNSLLASSAAVIPIAYSTEDRLYLQKLDKTLRLHWNENPCGPSPMARKALGEMISSANQYPDDLVDNLYSDLAGVLNVAENQIGLTAGSTEVLTLLGQHVALVEGEILSPWPSFPTLMMHGERLGATVKKVDLDLDQRLDLEALHDAITPSTTLIFVCNPNNPTSTEVEPEQLKSFCRSVPKDVMILVDEAYIEYSSHGTSASMIPLIDELSNLIVCRTFSKAHGLAGLRLGYAVSQEQNVKAVRDRHPGGNFSMNAAAVMAATASLKDTSFIDMVVAKTAEGKAILSKALSNWNVRYSTSSTNFMYVEQKMFSPSIVEDLADQNILITKWPTMTDHIRISIQEPEDMQSFVRALEGQLI